MENYINTNDLLRKTAIPNIFHESEIQQQADLFLSTMQEWHGEDEQYKHFMEEIGKEKIEPISWENPLKSARLAGFLAKIFNWVRDHEVQQLREEYERAQAVVSLYLRPY
jgi:hypothetical protein